MRDKYYRNFCMTTTTNNIQLAVLIFHENSNQQMKMSSYKVLTTACKNTKKKLLEALNNSNGTA